jgi:capsular exopolysaccharide synthesis family protein
MNKQHPDNFIMKAENGSNLPVTPYRDSIPNILEEEVNLKDYLEVILRRKWLVIGILFFTFVSTLIFSLAAEKQYQAEGSLEVNQETQRVTKFEDVVTEKLRGQEFISTQISLLTSDVLAFRTIKKLNLAEHPLMVEKEEDSSQGLMFQVKSFIKSLVKTDDKQQDLLANTELSEVMDQKKLLDFFKERLDVSNERDSMIINVSFMSPSRQLSMDSVNTLMEEFVNWKMDQKIEASKKASEFLIKQIDRAKINLEKAEEKQNEFAKQAGIVSMDSKINSIYRQLEDITAALGSAEANLSEKEASYQQALKDGPLSLPQVLNSQLINTLKSEYAGLRSEYENLTQTFHEEYPEVKTLKSRMDSIKERIDDESQKIFNSIKHDYEAALSRVESLNKKVQEKKQQALDLNERATQYKIMEREVETNKAIYQSLLERVKEIESMAGVSPTNIQVIDRASLPIFPAKPDVKRNLLLAIVLGLMAGIGTAFLMEYFADTITNPDQISERFQIPILGVIPLEKEKPEYPVEKIFNNDPRAGLSEAIRTAKVSIQLSGSNSQSKIIAITSTAPGEGKTTVSSNLAQAFAGAGEKVVMIDADLRKPRLHHIFKDDLAQNNGHGLSSFLAGVIDDGFMAKTSIENVYVIPSGPIPPNPVELLASNRFSQLIQGLAEKFDRIIVDSPPHSGFADVLVLSRQVGGIILVCGMGETTRDGLRHFKKAMANIQGNVLGCIVNKLNLSKRYGYHSYYKYYKYYYGDKRVDSETAKLKAQS